jgi:hypothetical protein
MNEEISKRLDDFERRLRALEIGAGLRPPAPVKSDYQPFDYTAQLRLPKSAMDDLVRAVPDQVVRDIAKDGRK